MTVKWDGTDRKSVIKHLHAAGIFYVSGWVRKDDVDAIQAKMTQDVADDVERVKAEYIKRRGRNER